MVAEKTVQRDAESVEVALDTAEVRAAGLEVAKSGDTLVIVEPADTVDVADKAEGWNCKAAVDFVCLTA